MFQYAAGRALALRLKVPLSLNISWYDDFCSSINSRAFLLSLFPHIDDSVIRIEDLSPSVVNNVAQRWSRRVQRLMRFPLPLFPLTVFEPYFAFWPGMARICKPVSLHGYWQCERYFADCFAQIRNDFIFPVLPLGPPSDLADRIRECPSAVSVHIRRGDYVSDQQAMAFHGLMGQDYYGQALRLIQNSLGKATLFLFSDDPQWVREHFDCFGHEGVVVDLGLPEVPLHDMHLMALCRHHIIANSSFSWWGAWLGEHGGLTIAPRRWFADPKIDTSDVIPKRWITL